MALDELAQFICYDKLCRQFIHASVRHNATVILFKVAGCIVYMS